ncbi:DUF5132 domain-containing protein [Acuticoccus mangrovi]|uniref:DUF5132 domain-containing protein n=1 Tax=Acuticoccus mangrovi TaxID=2796142 RepID=A0A934MGH6_9HYPH|nr:DUF5132 domain-containing protein [Acuticoccus mangrovi]MBJ3776593.1 DUF5132 domain-containing protein [Acuticoccus mangrovi]
MLLGIGVAVGVGATLFGPSIWRATRPAAKSALRAGIDGYAAARLAAAKVGEEVEDLVAEVVFEMSEEKAAADSSEEPSAHAPGESEARGAAAAA